MLRVHGGVPHFTSLEYMLYKNKDLLFSFPLEKSSFPQTGSPMSEVVAEGVLELLTLLFVPH